MTTQRQFGAIHAIRKAVGIEDADYRDLMAHHTGKGSSKALSDDEAERFIAVLRTLDGRPTGSRSRLDRAEGRYAKTLQALWISGHKLGLVNDRSDKAMMRFVERQTGLPHTRFLVADADGRRAVEALKQWLARGGVRWADHPATPHGRKLAVIAAMARALVEAGGFTPFLDRTADPWPAEVEAYGAARGLPARFDAYKDDDLIVLTSWLGDSLAALRGKRPKGGKHAEH